MRSAEFQIDVEGIRAALAWVESKGWFWRAWHKVDQFDLLLLKHLKLCVGELDRLKAQNEKLAAVVEAAASVLSEEGVREHLLAYVMGVVLCDRLDALEADP